MRRLRKFCWTPSCQPSVSCNLYNLKLLLLFTFIYICMFLCIQRFLVGVDILFLPLKNLQILQILPALKILSYEDGEYIKIFGEKW